MLFESHPGFYVTAGLFLPKERQNPAPAVIYACGHTDLGFRSKTYQHVILNLVDKGFIVLAFDPLGQGERLQYPDAETGKSKVGGSTKEHSYAGVQTLLTGTSLTDYFIWDGIRVLDYLETRPEVDMKRIGITGRSGGGTQTAQIAACDDRIYAAAPECYITSFKRLLQSIGPQDAEQNPYNAIAKGFDHADYLHSRAPKPALMITTTHDFFSIQGARETFAEVQKSYTAFRLTAAVYLGTFTKNNIRVEKYFLENNLKDFALPVYLIKNETNNTEKLVVWFHPEGKQKLLDEPLLSVLLQGGHTVICADLPGTGELCDPEFTGDGVIQGIPFNYTFGANLAGKSIPGIQAEAIDLLMQFTGNRFSDKPTEAMVQGIAASAVLYYAVLKNPFSKMTFRNFPEPVEKLITREYYNPAVAFTAAPGSLNVYDLPDLVEYLNNAGTEIITKSADK